MDYGKPRKGTQARILLFALVQVVAIPAEATPQKTSEYTVFYVDYGNQEVVPFSSLRPLAAAGGALPVVPVRGDCPGLAQLCQLAHVKVPLLEEDFGVEAAQKLQELSVGRTLLLRLEQRDTSGGKGKGQNTGTCWLVTLVDSEATLSVNAAMLQVRRLWHMSGVLCSCRIVFESKVMLAIKAAMLQVVSAGTSV